MREAVILDEAYCLAAAKSALFRWAQVVSSNNLEDVLILYASDAILVPTLSDVVRDREEDRRTYFETFMTLGITQCKIEIIKKRVSRKLGTVVIGGLYTFTFERGGAQELVPARFLFTFEEIDGRWLITGHHSSRLADAV